MNKIAGLFSALAILSCAPAAFAQINGSPEEYVVTNKEGSLLTCTSIQEGPQGATIKKPGFIGLIIYNREYAEVSTSCIPQTDAMSLKKWNWVQPLENYDNNQKLAHRIDNAIWDTVKQFGDPNQL